MPRLFYNDDSSVDSKGNIRGLIDYDDSDEDFIMAEPGILLKKVPAKKKASTSKNITKSTISRTKYHRDAKDKANKSLKELSNISISTNNTPIKTTIKTANKTIINDESDDEDSDYESDESFDFDYTETDDEEEADEDDEDEEAEEEEDEEDEEAEEEEDEEEAEKDIYLKKIKKGKNDIGNVLSQLFDDGKTPRRHNMKKEPEIVRNFVKLITAPIDETDIDTQIDQFKSLPEERQQNIIKTLQARPPTSDASSSLMFKILDMNIPAEIQATIRTKYHALEGMDPTTGEYFKTKNWLEKVCSVPFGKYKEMPVKLTDGNNKCEEFMKHAKKALDEAVFGQNQAKLQILQFIATKITNPTADGTNLLLIGPPGIGKTSLIKNGISKALDWPFQFISLGGETDASTYNGHQVVYEGSHAGKIVNSIIAAKSMSMVMMFDEVDKISNTPKGEEIQHMLVHLTDPVQNMCFEDKYLANIPIDLGKIMFVFSANDISKLDRILLDRMRVVQLKGYSMSEKLNIAESFLIPEALAQVNLVEKVSISQDVLKYIIEEHAKEEAGVRELRRCIEQVSQKLNMLRIYNNKELSFHIPGFQLPFIVKKEHVDLFIKKKVEQDTSFMRMYV